MDILSITLHSYILMNQQLAEWVNICPSIWVSRVHVLGTSYNSCRWLISVISFISEKLGLTIYFLFNKYVLRLLRMLRLLSRKTFIFHPVPSSFKVCRIFLFSFFTDLLNVNVLYTLIHSFKTQVTWLFAVLGSNALQK